MGKILKIIVGVALVLAGAYTIYLWWGDVLMLIRGGIGCALILAGLICFALLD